MIATIACTFIDESILVESSIRGGEDEEESLVSVAIVDASEAT